MFQETEKDNKLSKRKFSKTIRHKKTNDKLREMEMNVLSRWRNLQAFVACGNYCQLVKLFIRDPLATFQ